jgi:aspartate/methionine/tyrosine aminotransferase
MKNHSHQLGYIKDSVFGVMSQLSQKYSAINLSQGFPDFDCSNDLKSLVTSALNEGHNQYAPFMGRISTREAISGYYKKFYSLNFDAEKEITITNGATEAIFSTILALVNPGDEVIVFEPFYDSYYAAINLAHGKVVPVTLKAPDFKWDLEELKKKFNEKTKLVIFNNPHNPTGKMFSSEELEELAKLVIQYDSYILSDEVYEFMTYDKNQHRPFMELSQNYPELKEKVITISSMGKTFGVTGWKVGWVIASSQLSKSIRLVHQYNVFSVSTPFQVALEKVLPNLDYWVSELKKDYLQKRDYFFQVLEDLNFKPLKPQGTYFIVSPIEHLTKLNSWDFSLKLVQEFKLATIPLSAFYEESREGDHYIRFCFAKKQETLENAKMQLKHFSKS